MSTAQHTNDDQRRDRLDALTAHLETEIAAIQSSDTFKAYLRTAAKFHQYSYNNVLLIAQQCPEASCIAGYNAWKALGRNVRKGERAIRILAPVTRPVDKTTPTEADAERGRYVVGFRAAPVFDIAQTDGDDLPTIAMPRLDGEHGADVYAALYGFGVAQGLDVTTHDPYTQGDDTRSRYDGYYSRREQRIFVKPDAQAQMTRVLIHELAHHLDPLLKQTPRNERETVAEAAAFMVAAHFDLDTSAASFPYIAGWAGAEDGTEILKRVMQRTQKIAHTLIEAVAAGMHYEAPVTATA